MPDPIESLGPTPECPSLETLSAAKSDPAVRRHLETCAHCRGELAMFQEFVAAEPRPEEAADLAWVNAEMERRNPAGAPKVTLAVRLRAWFTLPRLSLAAAALVLLITTKVYLPSRNQQIHSNQQETSQWRSGQIGAIAPIGDQDHPPSALRWESVPDAASYHVRLLEVDGNELWSADVITTSAEFPNTVAAIMLPGRAFQWECTARDSSGHTIASTNLQSFHNLATQR